MSKLKFPDKFGNVYKLPDGGKVPCFPLPSILAALNVNHVDFLSLDIEGQELAVLKTLPFNSSLTIDVITHEKASLTVITSLLKYQSFSL